MLEESKHDDQHKLASGAAVGGDVGGGRVPAPGGAVSDPCPPGLVLFVVLCLEKRTWSLCQYWVLPYLII